MIDDLEQGFFGISIQNGKTPEDLGVLCRSDQNMVASFIFTVRIRYSKQASDTPQQMVPCLIFIARISMISRSIYLKGLKCNWWHHLSGATSCIS
jgi:hypothetical protein